MAQANGDSVEKPVGTPAGPWEVAGGTSSAGGGGASRSADGRDAAAGTGGIAAAASASHRQRGWAWRPGAADRQELSSARGPPRWRVRRAARGARQDQAAGQRQHDEHAGGQQRQHPTAAPRRRPAYIGTDVLMVAHQQPLPVMEVTMV